MSSCNSHIINKAESRGCIFTTVVSRWADRDKGARRWTRDHSIDGLAHCSQCTLDCVDGTGAYYPRRSLNMLVHGA
jgi:hypothetical protein